MQQDEQVWHGFEMLFSQMQQVEKKIDEIIEKMDSNFYDESCLKCDDCYDD